MHWVPQLLQGASANKKTWDKTSGTVGGPLYLREHVSRPADVTAPAPQLAAEFRDFQNESYYETAKYTY